MWKRVCNSRRGNEACICSYNSSINWHKIKKIFSNYPISVRCKEVVAMNDNKQSSSLAKSTEISNITVEIKIKLKIKH